MLEDAVMTPPAHFLAGWLVANCGGACRRDRALVTLAAVLPDLDGFGYVVEYVSEWLRHPLYWYANFHHVLCHNALFGALMVAAAALVAKQKWKTALLVLVAFHVHLLMDLAGSKGPDGDPWEISYLLPFSSAWPLTWSGQWALDSWLNKVIGVAMLAVTVVLAWWRGFSPFEIFSKRADAAFVGMLRRLVPLRRT